MRFFSLIAALSCVCAFACSKDKSAEQGAAAQPDEVDKPVKPDTPDTPDQTDTPDKPTPVADKPPLRPTDPAAKEYLSVVWAVYQNLLPGGRAPTTERGAEAKIASEALRKQGFALYKQKQDKQALVKYEEALQLWASGPLYYDYANSLSNIPRLEDSVKAYEIAIKLGGHDRPELVFYNIACAYSRMKQAEPAYDYLGKAIARGYNAFRYIEKDKDLKFLRAQPDWKARIEALTPKDMTYGRKELTGHVEIATPRDSITYTLCGNGKVIHHAYFSSDGSCCGASFYGTWKVNKGDLVIEWTEVCERLGTGEVEGVDTICTNFKQCTETVCRPPKGDEPKTEILLEREAVALMVAGNYSDDEEYEGKLNKFGKTPAECK